MENLQLEIPTLVSVSMKEVKETKSLNETNKGHAIKK